jgi:pimeloyl-ACP methyl ester carboxylesterase
MDGRRSGGALRRELAAFSLLAPVFAAGCALGPDGLSPKARAEIERRRAEEEVAAFAAQPRALARPVVLIAGWNDGPEHWADFRERLAACAPGHADRIVVPDLRGDGGLEAAADRLTEACAGLGEVDVVAHSLGGLVAREAARDRRGERRLRISRLFTIATPHLGTGWARFWPIVPNRRQAADCRATSEFLASLNADPSSKAMAIRAYWCEGDVVVAKESACAVGEVGAIYPRAPGARVHDRCVRDARFARDVIPELLAGE